MIVARQPILDAVARARQLAPELGDEAAIAAAAQSLRIPEDLVRETVQTEPQEA